MRAHSERAAVVRLVLVLVVVGAVLGTGWALLAPALPVGVASDGTRVVLDPESRSRFDPVALFALASLAVGLLTGGITWFWRRWRGVSLLVAVVLGSLLSGAVAEAVALAVAALRYRSGVDPAAVGSTVSAAPELGTWALVLVQPFGAAVAHVVAVAFSHDDQLGVPPADRREDVPPSELQGPDAAGPPAS